MDLMPIPITWQLVALSSNSPLRTPSLEVPASLNEKNHNSSHAVLMRIEKNLPDVQGTREVLNEGEAGRGDCVVMLQKRASQTEPAEH